LQVGASTRWKMMLNSANGEDAKSFVDNGSHKPQERKEQRLQRLQAEAKLMSLGNKFAEAIQLWDEFLSIHPRDAEALNQKGMCYMRLGRSNDAMKLYEEAIYIDPKHWSAHNNRGVILKELGDLANAVEAYKTALQYGPSDSVARSNIAMALTDLGTQMKIHGHTDVALQHYNEALKYDSEYAPAHFDIGVVFSKLGKYDEALNAYNKALSCNPNYIQALCNVGVLYKNANKLETAIHYYQRALEVDPNFEIAKNNIAIAYTDLGTKLKNSGDIGTGIKWYKKALVHNPKYPDAWYNLGVACAANGQPEEAIVYYEIAATFNPQCAEAYNNQGVIYKELGNLQKSISCYNKALNVNPAFALTLNNLGVIYTSLGKLDQAYKYCLRAVQANNRYAEAYNNLGVLFRDEGDINKAINSYDRSLKIDPYSKNAGQNRLLAMNSLTRNHMPRVRSLVDYVYQEHKKWGERFQSMYKTFTSWDNELTTDRPLRIGYISADFFTHSVSYFIELPLRLADNKRVFNICYSNVARTDARTKVFKDLAHKWVEVFGRAPEDVAEMIRKDKVDILVELTGHTAGNRLDVMAQKPAPVQVTWIGYPNTTGLNTIDYRFCDAIVDPPNTKQKYTERLERLPNTFLCYSPPSESPPVSLTPALSNGFVTFGSFNNFAKFNDQVLYLWTAILKRVPMSRLLMKCKPFACMTMQKKVLQRFQALGIESRRIDLFPLFPTTREHLSLYSLVDISIDTFPYAGATTTCEAMYMGVPVVTLRSQEEDIHAHNVGCSLVSNIPSLKQLVTKTPEEYVDVAVKLASDIKGLNTLRQKLREEMLSSPLCDGDTFVKNLENKYQDIWERHCTKAISPNAASSQDVKMKKCKSS